MITQEQIDTLKGGEKLIFFRNGGGLSTKAGNVFTFANWWSEDDKWLKRMKAKGVSKSSIVNLALDILMPRLSNVGATDESIVKTIFEKEF